VGRRTANRSKKGSRKKPGRRRNDPPRPAAAPDETPAPTSDPRVVHAKLLLNPAGFAFAEREDDEPSIFIPPAERGGAMDGDRVVVSWWPAERGPEGSVRSVVRRARTRVTGVLRKAGKRFFVQPDDPRVLGQAEVIGVPKAALGMVVVAAIVDYPEVWRNDFTVKVERTLGAPGSLVTEEARILVEQGIDPELPKAVLKAAESVPVRVRNSDRRDRVDMRELDFMTIDPDDARDFDDAVYVEVHGKDLQRAKMRVHVAVADVSHYVHESDVFDTEAVYRCFSTYLPARVIPMLPMPLSAGICSLVPRKERCAMVVSFDLDATGRMGEAEVAAATIKSKMRLTYGQVAAELRGKRRLPPEVGARIRALRTASDRLQKARARRGSIVLDLPETKVLLDEDDRERVRDVVPARRDPHVSRAYNLVEELMVAANEAVARIGIKHRLPLVYRVHDKPDDERVERFVAVADLLGVEADPEKIRTPKGVQALLRKIEGHPRRASLHGLLLRTLAQAEYSTHNLGHFALASGAYAHFTSPIRRYPDLVNHRVMKAWLQRKGGPAGPEPVPKMPPLKESTERAERSSQRERVVTQAERDAKALLSAAFMRDRIGDRFEGTVTGISRGGAFVMLDKPPVDGMIRRTLIEREFREPFKVDDMGASMTGEKSNRRLMIGDRVIVEITDVSLQRRQIDLALMGQID
jgi:ribonuclease R